MVITDKPLRCKLGMHSWYMDGAMWNAADRCDGCGKWRTPHEGAAVERERAAWKEDPDAMARAARKMFDLQDET